MTEYYIEITEEDTEVSRPLEMVRKYVKDEKEAELVYKTESTKFTKEVRAKFIEMNHNKDSKLNKPCRVKDLKDGKIALEWK